MMLIRNLRRMHGDCCEVDKCRDAGCKAEPPNPPRCIISGSRYQANHDPNGKLADFLIFWKLEEDHSLAVVELKGGRFSATEVIAQLQAGAELADRLSEGFPLRFSAFLVKKRRLSSMEQKRLGQAKIKFRKKRYPIKIINDGATIE